jgi:transposase
MECDARVTDPQERFSSREFEIEHLKLMLAKLRPVQFSRKSEKLERQIDLWLEDLRADEGTAVEVEPKKARQLAASRYPTELKSGVRTDLSRHT